jgi:MipA family protein
MRSFIGFFLALAGSWVHAQNAEPLKPDAGLPLWEAGMAVVASQSPDYPAAASRHLRTAVLPVFIYRGSFFRADADGLRGRFFQMGGLELDISAAAAFNAGKSPARAGMPPLDYTFELGPQLRYRHAFENKQIISAHLKWRAVISTNGKQFHARGMVYEPELRWQHRPSFDPMGRWQLSIQATWADQKLQRYFYDVAPSYQTPNRPSYAARGGFLGSGVRLSRYQNITPSHSLNVSVGMQQHSLAANTQSPLFKRYNNINAALIWVWTPWRSEQRVD